MQLLPQRLNAIATNIVMVQAHAAWGTATRRKTHEMGFPIFSPITLWCRPMLHGEWQHAGKHMRWVSLFSPHYLMYSTCGVVVALNKPNSLL
jgi:hypothetical protein